LAQIYTAKPTYNGIPRDTDIPFIQVPSTLAVPHSDASTIHLIIITSQKVLLQAEVRSQILLAIYKAKLSP
jgi:hypothetical protein